MLFTVLFKCLCSFTFLLKMPFFHVISFVCLINVYQLPCGGAEKVDRLFNHQPSCFLGSQETNQPHLNFGFQKHDPPLTHHTTWVGSVILLVFRQGHGLWIAAAIAVLGVSAKWTQNRGFCFSDSLFPCRHLPAI